MAQLTFEPYPSRLRLASLSLAAVVVITASNLVMAGGATFVALQLGMPQGLLAVPVIAICGFAAIWQVVVAVRAKRRGEFR